VKKEGTVMPQPRGFVQSGKPALSQNSKIS